MGTIPFIDTLGTKKLRKTDRRLEKDDDSEGVGKCWGDMAKGDRIHNKERMEILVGGPMLNLRVKEFYIYKCECVRLCL